MTIEFVQLSLGGVIHHNMVDVPHDGDRWADSPAPTVRLLNRDGTQLLASTAATVDASRSLTSTATAKSRTIPMTSTTGLKRWEEYVVGPNATGQWEWVTLDAIGSTSVTTLDPLVNTYSTGHGIKSHTMSYQVSTTTAAAVAQNCFAQWRYTVDSIERQEHTVFSISRYCPRLSLTPAEVIQHEPRALKQIGSDQKIGLILKRMFENRVLPDVAKILGSPGALVSGEAVDEAVLLKFQEIVSRKAKDYEGAHEYANLYVHQLDEIRLSVTDLDESGGQDVDEVPRSMRTPRIMRG
jgi:hypothetical protein